MTASTPDQRHAHLDSTAQLMTEITAQFSTGLLQAGRNSLRGAGPRHTSRGAVPAGGAGAMAPSPGPEDFGGGPHPPALVAVAHGSRDPEALRTVTALLDRVRGMRPGLRVRLGHVELNEPLLADTLTDPAASASRPEDGRRGEAVLVPLLLSRGYHVKHDIPRILSEALATTASPAGHRLDARIAAPLGPHPLLVDALYDRLMEAADGRTGTAAAPRAALSGVVLASAGSRDPDSAADTRRTAELLGARLGGVPVIPGYASAASPTVPEAIGALVARGCRADRTAVASYFTAPGLFATHCAAAAPGPAAAPLGAHPALARLLLHRYDEAVTAAAQPSERSLVRL